MNHQKIYEEIIQKAQLENRKKLKKNDIKYVYYEKHHIIPKCINGTDDKENLVLLTAKEHYLCHKLLTFIYNDFKINSAFHRMTFDKRQKHYISLRDYEYAKIIKSQIPQKSHFEIWKEKYGEEEAFKREKLKKEKIKKTMTGVKYSQERKEKAAQGHIGIKQKNETIQRRVNKITGLKRLRKICEYCHKDVASNAYKIHHGEKCQFKKYNYE